MLRNLWLDDTRLQPVRPVLGTRPWLLLVVGAIAVLGVLSAWLRPLMPVDETRYATVAWEMWHRGSFLVPYLNGETYEHKPPALFWLVHLGWWVAGVNDVWPRAIGPLSMVACLLLLSRLGERLWPAQRDVGRLGSVMFLGTWFIALYQTGLMFDIPLLACLAAAWCALWDAGATGRRRHWAAFGLAIGVAAIVKGPVALVYTVPMAVGLRWWRPAGSPPMPRSGPGLATLLALLPAALWLAAAWAHGDGAYFEKLLVDQTLHRVTGSMGHPRPPWWYLLPLLLMPLPWTFWPAAWAALRRVVALRAEPGVRFVAIGAIAAFALLSVVGGKQVHYLIPVLALGFLAVARGLRGAPDDAAPHSLFVPVLMVSSLFLVLVGAAVQGLPSGLHDADEWRLWLAPAVAIVPVIVLAGMARDVSISAIKLAALNLTFVAALILIVLPLGRDHLDLHEAAAFVAAAQAQGRPAAYVGNYQGEFGFLGRLSRPLAELSPAQANAWVRENPDGLVVVRRKRLHLAGAPPIEFRQPYKTDEILMLRASQLVDSGSALREPGANPFSLPNPTQ